VPWAERATRDDAGRIGGMNQRLPTIKQGSVDYDLFKAERGLASVEYVIVLVSVTLVATWAVFALGFYLVDAFEWQTAVLGLPIP
jgi:Flp pilus assembly pilin Flp